MPNPFCHVELASTNVPKAKKFYSKLFKWKLKDMPMGPGETYTMIDVGDGTGGGMMTQIMPGAGSVWMPYVLVKDIDASTKKAKTLGAKICKGVTEIEGMGWLSIIVDPTGAMLGLWEPKDTCAGGLDRRMRARPRHVSRATSRAWPAAGPSR